MSADRVEYDDFRLLVEGAGGEYRVSVVESPVGETSAPEVVRWVPPAVPPTREDDLHRVGESLFESFLVGQVRDLYRAGIAHTMARQRGLRLKLMIGPRDLVHAPWELLYDRQNQCYVGLSSRSPIVRHPQVPQVIEPLTVEPPLRLLGMVANPRAPGLPQLNVARERKVIGKALAAAVKAGLVQIEWVEGGTSEALRRKLQQGWHAFHYAGHGDYDPESAEGYLLLEGTDGGPERLRAGDLGVLLRGEGNVRLAVLNSCKGAAGDTRASSSSAADALLRAGLGGVVAMQNPISDAGAITFARVTYLGIATGRPLDTAVGSARVAMKLAPTGPIEWWTPVLHLRARSGALFDLPHPAAPPRIKGMEFLGPDLDRRMEQALARRRTIGRAIGAWVLAAVLLLIYLALPVSSDIVRADLEAAAVAFTLASEREIFSELPRLTSLEATGFRQASLPGSAFPVRPDPNGEGGIRAVARDTRSWISLQPWTLPAGSWVTLDRPRRAGTGEYAISLIPGEGRRFHLGLMHRVSVSRFGGAPEPGDFPTGAPVELVTAPGSLDIELRTAESATLSFPPLLVDSLMLARKGFGDAGPLLEPTVLGGQLRFDGRQTELGATPLVLAGLRRAVMDRIRFTERGIGFTITGPVEGITVGGRSLDFPARLRWVARERLPWLGLGAVAYLLVLLAGVLAWRTPHVASATAM